MELSACGGLDPGLHAIVLIPDNTFEKWVNQAHDDCRCNQLGPELGALRNAARNDGRNGCRKSQQKEELHQLIAILGSQLLCAHKETGAVSHAIANQKIRDSGH